MQIHLNERELHQAVEQFISYKGLDLSGKRLDIRLTAGRGPNGFYADIDIKEPGEASDEELPFDSDTLVEEEETPTEEQLGFDFDDGDDFNTD